MLEYENVKLSKEDIKNSIGRSPDDSDTWIMRMYFYLREKMLPDQSEQRNEVILRQVDNFNRNERNFLSNSTK